MAVRHFSNAYDVPRLFRYADGVCRQGMPTGYADRLCQQAVTETLYGTMKRSSLLYKWSKNTLQRVCRRPMPTHLCRHTYADNLCRRPMPTHYADTLCRRPMPTTYADKLANHERHVTNIKCLAAIYTSGTHAQAHITGAASQSCGTAALHKQLRILPSKLHGRCLH